MAARIAINVFGGAIPCGPDTQHTPAPRAGAAAEGSREWRARRVAGRARQTSVLPAPPARNAKRRRRPTTGSGKSPGAFAPPPTRPRETRACRAPRTCDRSGVLPAPPAGGPIQWISQRLKSIRADGDPQLISVGEKQAEAATEECYDAWHALNEHQCSERCERGEHRVPPAPPVTLTPRARPGACGRPACFRRRRHGAPKRGDCMRGDSGRAGRKVRRSVALGAAGGPDTRTACASPGRPRAANRRAAGAAGTGRRTKATACGAISGARDAQNTVVRRAGRRG